MPGKKIDFINLQTSPQTQIENSFHATLRLAYGSRITLTSPDPSAVSIHKRTKRDTAQSDTHEVTFTPHDDATDDEVAKERKISDEL